jgi:CheY-like chemotaxis protein
MGSTFTVALPLTVIHPEPDPDFARRHPSSGKSPALGDTCLELAGVKVLVVDDEPDARWLVQRLLEDCKAVVTTAASAREALDRMRDGRPDVLVSDIGMPGEDGYSLIRKVRALGAAGGGDVPAIALTAYARAEDRMKAMLAGFQQHVVKPVEPVELITVVAILARRVAR